MDQEPSKKPQGKRKKSPKHAVEIRAYVFPLEVNCSQHLKLTAVITTCHSLRNLLAAERIDNRHACREAKQAGAEPAHYLTRNDQYKRVAALAKVDPALKAVYSQVLQNVAHRVDEGVKNWLDAVATGNTGIKPPKRIKRERYRSFTYPQYGTAAKISHGKLHLSKLGEFRVIDYRKIRGKPKTVTIKWKHGRWWCIITAEIQAKDLYGTLAQSDNRPDTGIAQGTSGVLVDAQGNPLDLPETWHDSRARLSTAKKKMSRQFKMRKAAYEEWRLEWVAQGVQPPSSKEMPYSNRLKRQIVTVGRLHTKVERVRDYHHKKHAAILADRYRHIGVEEYSPALKVRNSRLAKIATDRAVSNQKWALKSKLGTRYKAVSNRNAENDNNFRTCSCGAAWPITPKGAVYECLSCGLTVDCDAVSANIVQLMAFGSVSLGAGLYHLFTPESGQDFVRRGEVKAASSESTSGEPCNAALEISMKRHPHATRSGRKIMGAEATMAGKTHGYRQKQLPLPCAPQAVSSEEGEARPS